MAYIYQIEFDIHTEQLAELKIGASLERVLGYLRTLLPNESGYITSRALYSVDGDVPVHMLIQSEWETWEDLIEHRDASLVEDKILLEFEPQLTMEHLTVRMFNEVA